MVSQTRRRVSTDAYAALRGLRIGCVQYLNSRPLICAYDGSVIFEHPSALGRMLSAGELDVALVPVFKALSEPHFLLVDGAAVACDGPVFSVFLAYRGELADVQSVALDPASMTSAHLLQVLLAEYHGLHPTYGSTGDARLLIGNQAIEFRLAPENAVWRFLDLGAEWKRCTGLPFVFALWAMRADIPEPLAVADALRGLKKEGLQRIPALIMAETFATPEFRLRYLTQHIDFGIGQPAREAIAKYRELLTQHALIAPSPEPLRYV